VDDVQGMKTRLIPLLDHLNRKPLSARTKKEMQRLKALKTTVERAFRTILNENNRLSFRPYADFLFQFLEILSSSGLSVPVSIVHALDALSHESRQEAIQRERTDDYEGEMRESPLLLPVPKGMSG